MKANGMMCGDSLALNGVNGSNGHYLFDSTRLTRILAELEKLPLSSERALVPGVDPKKLEQCGWGVVFHKNEDPAVVEALRPLLALRESQAAKVHEGLYREFVGDTGYNGEDKETFLTCRGAAPGAVNPRRMPFYLLLVGSPRLIPFHFQQQLDVQYGVGRICFDTPEEYSKYASSVVAAESDDFSLPRRLGLFGVRVDGDAATELSADMLVQPLAKNLASPADWQSTTPWEIQLSVAGAATKARLKSIINEGNSPALLFTASHGLGFWNGDPQQRDHQGALLCQDWPGEKAWQSRIPTDFYFSGDDVSSGAHIHGMVAFLFACYGAGTPEIGEYAMRDNNVPEKLAPEPFVARLPQRLLAHPGGGALAVIGHVEQAWAYSFLAKNSQAQTEAFDSTLRLLMEGYPVGYAMEYFNQRYAESATELTLALQKLGYGEAVDLKTIAALWTANNDARNYAVLGDPAVRVAVK